MLSLTEARSGALIGVLVSVTTIPAVGNVGAAAAYGAWSEVGGAALQLAINVTRARRRRCGHARRPGARSTTRRRPVGSSAPRRDSFTQPETLAPYVGRVREEHTAGAVDVQLGPRERAVLSALVDQPAGSSTATSCAATPASTSSARAGARRCSSASAAPSGPTPSSRSAGGAGG